MNFIKTILITFFLFNIQVYANENKEINLYTIYKYKADYNKLSNDQQSKINKEYKELQKLSNKVQNKIKQISIYKVKNNISIFETWSNKFLNEYKPKEKELKTIYSKNSFNTSPEYKLKTLTLKNEKRAQSILKQLQAKKTKKDRIRLFNIFVKKDSIDKTTKSKQGNLGWINQSKLLPKIRQEIVKLKVNDVMTLVIKDNIQILYLEDIKKPRKASFNEAKALLVKIAKQQALKKEIEKIVK